MSEEFEEEKEALEAIFEDDENFKITEGMYITYWKPSDQIKYFFKVS